MTVQLSETTDTTIAKGYLYLIRAFFEAEQAPLDESTLPNGGEEAAKVTEELREISSGIDELLIDLMARRIAVNKRQVPLLRATDADRLLAGLLRSEPLSKNTVVAMTMGRPLIELGIAGRISFLSAIDDDLYAGFWRFAQALMNEAVTSRCTLTEVTQLPLARSAVYRACMTPTSWRKLTAARIALIGGVSASTLIGALGGLADDDDVASRIDEIVSQADTVLDDTRAARLKRLRTFYAKRGREIWPSARN